jgi:adenylate cyclase class IV
VSGEGGRELEVKAVVDDAEALERRLGAGGAVPGFRGRMSDRRYDFAGGALTARDEVLRVRTFTPAAGSAGRPAEVAWKGPTRRQEGYKSREEHQLEVADAGAVESILSRLGFVPADAVDRCVEFFGLCGAVVRIEWYPRMDVLVEVEGEPGAIELAVRATGLPRAQFRSDRLLDFAERYRTRTGTAPALSLAALGAEHPAWPPWAP